MVKQPTFEIVLGTYEEFLLGYNFIAKDSDISQSFAAHDHTSSIRSLAASGPYLASGGADDRIIVYDLKTRKEHCMLTHHDSTVTTIEFTKNHSHIISGSSDGVLAIVRTGNWQLEKLWEKAHKGASILDVAIHPSGKLALTLGSDGSLRTWNLVKGRQAYIINLQSKSKDAHSLEKLIWSSNETNFILFGGKYVEVWSIETGGLLKYLELEHKISSVIWLDEETVIIGLENGTITKWNIKTNESNLIEAHTSRIKVIVTYEDYIVTGTSSGTIKVWDKYFEEISKIETGCRITCAVIIPPFKVKQESREPENLTTVTEVVKKATKTKVVVEIEESDEEVETTPKLKKKKQKKCLDTPDVPQKKMNIGKQKIFKAKKTKRKV